MKKSRIILLAGLAVIIIVVGIGLMMYFKPHKTFAGADPDFEVTAGRLIEEFSNDERAATAKYVAEDKIVLVRGIIDGIETDDRGIAVITLTQNGIDGSVSCTLTSEESKTANELSTGDAVRITGQCTGMQGLIEPQVIMIRCGVAKE